MPISKSDKFWRQMAHEHPGLYYIQDGNNNNNNALSQFMAVLIVIVVIIILINVYVYPIPLVKKVIPSKKNKNN